MNVVEAALRRIGAELDARGVPWALVGGFAVSARTEPRFTRVVDVAVSVDSDAAAEDLVRSLVTEGYRLGAVVEQDDVGVLATARLVGPGDPGTVVVDLLFATAGIEPEVVAGAEVLELLPGLWLPVACVGDLVALSCCPVTTGCVRRTRRICAHCRRLSGHEMSWQHVRLSD